MRITLLPACSAALGAAAAGAQCPESHSFFAGIPAALSVAEDPAVPFDPAQLLHKPVGFHTALPTAWPTPQFRLRDVMIQHGAVTPPDVDAFSTGQDWLLIDCNGAVQVPTDRWGALTFSVSRTSQGREGSAIRSEAVSAAGAGADVFSYVFRGSALPGELVGVTTRAQDDREIDLGGGAPREIDALDHYAPLYLLSRTFRTILPANPQMFFSVSRATIPRVPTAWWGGTPRSAASIFVTAFNPATGGWNQPRIHLRFDQLGLTSTEDVDALAIDLAAARVLFSTKTASRNQLLVASTCLDGAVAVTVTEGGTPLTVRLDLLEGDDVDAVCGIDPSVRARPNGPANPFFFFMGTPVAKLFPGDTVRASVFRDVVGGNDVLRSYCVGWPSRGPGAGFAALLLAPAGALSPLFPLTLQNRNLAAVWCGDPRSHVITIPPALVFSAVAVDFRWIVGDSPITELVDAHPLRIRL
jgi:hypothetical protein